jgi:vacuolar-type H+-ATPase subunit H
MDDLLSELARLLINLGGGGWIVALGSVCITIYLYRDIWKREERHFAVMMELRAEFLGIQKERREEIISSVKSNKETIGSLEANTLALESNNRVMEARTKATESIERAVSDLLKQAEFQDERLRTRIEGLAEGLQKSIDLLGKDVTKAVEDCIRSSFRDRN